MNIKFLAILSLFVILSSCKQKQETSIHDNKDEKPTKKVTEKELSKLNYIEFLIDAKTEKTIEDWTDYIELQTIVTNIKKADLSYFDNQENSIKEFIKNIKQTIPTAVKTDATLARITVLETKFYKLESLTKLSTTSKKELIKGIKEFLESFSNLNFQMNKKVEKDSQNIERP